MKTKWLICIGAAFIPLGAANGQGLRLEALAGLDSDGFDRGALLGARIGYDFRVASNVSIGIDSEWNDITTKQRSNDSPIVIHYGPEIYIGGRITLAVSNRVRLFAGAGSSRSNFGNFFLVDQNNPSGPVGAETGPVNGFRLTTGAQFQLGRRAFLGVEYRSSNYEDRFFNRGQLAGSIGFRF